MTEPWDDLGATYARVWDTLIRGVHDRHAAARHPVLATVGTGGGAEARMVVLRGAERVSGELAIHTDGTSAKIAEIEATPDGTLHIWDANAKLQIRLRVTLSLRQGTDEEWARVPEGSRRAYGGTPPGTLIDRPENSDPVPDRTRFVVITAQINEIETLRLGRERHNRTLFRRQDGFAGQWLAP